MSSDGAEASMSSDDAKNLASELLAFEREMWELHHPGLLPEVGAVDAGIRRAEAPALGGPVGLGIARCLRRAKVASQGTSFVDDRLKVGGHTS